MDRVGDAIVRDVCERTPTGLDRLRLSDALSEFERNIALESFEGHGFNDTAFGEYLADNAEDFADEAPRLAQVIGQFRETYGYGD